MKLSPRGGRGTLPVLLALCVAGCASSGASDPMRYRLTETGASWDRVRGDAVLEDLEPRYPEYFAVVLDPSRSDEPRLRQIKNDIERTPVDRRNFDALNAVAIGYFEINFQGERMRREGEVGFVTAGFRTAHIAAVPWKAYGLVDDPSLRDAILDFFDDVAHGGKPGSGATAGRLARIVASLVPKEPDPVRRKRIEALAAALGSPAESPFD